MEKYLYFRKSATLTDDHDGESGSVLYPASALRGMVAQLYATYDGDAAWDAKVSMDYHGVNLIVYGNGNVVVNGTIDSLGNVVL